MSDHLFPLAWSALGAPGGRFRGAIFAGQNPHSTMVWVSRRSHSRSGLAIRDAVAALPEVRRAREFRAEA